MRGVNRVIIIGNLGKDAETRYTTSGTAVCNFSIAINEAYKKNDQWEERTEWVNVVLFGRTAEGVGEYLTKGQAVYVEGKIRTEKWTDKQGNDRYTTKVYGDRVLLLGGRRGERQEQDEDDDQEERRPAKKLEKEAAPDFDDDIPF